METSIQSAGEPGAPRCSEETQDQTSLRAGRARWPQVLRDRGDFGPSGLRLVAAPGASVEDRLFDLRCLFEQALALFEEMSVDEDTHLHPLYWAGLYLLRQSDIALAMAEEAEQSTRGAGVGHD